MKAASIAAATSSKRLDWETPDPLFRLAESLFGPFTIDVCATASNTKCERYFSPEQDGLAQSWSGERCWLNPPYGNEIVKWVAKAHRECSLWHGSYVVGLLPVRSDTAWWHNHVMLASQIVLIEGRVKFVGAKDTALFPSCFVVWETGLLSRYPLVNGLRTLDPYTRGGTKKIKALDYQTKERL